MHFRRPPPKCITYRDLKKFNNERFMNSLQSMLFDLHTDYNIHDPDIFFQIFQKVLNNNAPRQKKYICGNHTPFMNKRLSKAIIQQTHFRNKFLKNTTDESKYIYIEQRNLCLSLLRNEKKQICCQFNEAICSSIFLASFKLANITPVFKAGPGKQKDNYRPITILLIIEKIFEKLISQELSSHFDNIFSKFQCGVQKGFCTHHCLLLMIEK